MILFQLSEVVHHFIATILFRIIKNDHTHQALQPCWSYETIFSQKKRWILMLFTGPNLGQRVQFTVLRPNDNPKKNFNLRGNCLSQLFINSAVACTCDLCPVLCTYSFFTEIMNIWKSYMWTTVRSEELFEGRSSQLYTQLCSCEKKTRKKFRLVRDSSPWPPRYRCSALPIKLTSQLYCKIVCSCRVEHFGKLVLYWIK